MIIPFVSDISPASQQAWLDHLRAALPDAHILPEPTPAQLERASLAIVANPDPADLWRMPNLKWVQSLWAGVEHLIPALPQDVTIVRMTDPQLAQTMAEAVLTMTLYLHRDLPRYVSPQRAAIWHQHPVSRPQERFGIEFASGGHMLSAMRAYKALPVKVHPPISLR